MKKIILLTSVIALLFSNLQAQVNLDSGLVLYYPFNGNANDESGNGNNGTEFGGIVYLAGIIGQTARFDGIDDYIRNSNPPVVQVLDSIFSISLWIKPEGNQNSGIIDIGQETKETWEIYHNSQLVGFVQNWNRPQGIEVFPYNLSAPLNVWTHITFVYDNRHLDAYSNGLFVAGANFINKPVIDGDEWIEVGVNAPALDEYFIGQIDEVRIYNRSLSIAEIEALYSEPTTLFQLSVSIEDGWNMVSVPGLHQVNQNVNTWWAFRDLGANVFKYAGGYQSVTDAVPGIGYWMKHSGDRTYNTGDEWPAGGIQIVPHEPLTAAAGWNLIGGYEISATASNVTTNPPGLQSGPIYKYSGGYQPATTIDPGYGYWIKLNAAGQIIIPETMAKGEAVEHFPEDWGRIVFTDNAGQSYKMYAVSDKSNIDLSSYELPPAPPEGMFDIRYESGRIAEDINSSIKTIDMSGVTYPLTVRAEGMDIRLMDEKGKAINVNLKDGEDVVISDATIQKLMVSGEMIPTVYVLEQNFPNPFNPSTKIKFSIPKEVQVNLNIYNILGERVKELKNEMMKPGYYEVEFDASDLASGIYLYRIKAGNFVETKKMVLLK